MSTQEDRVQQLKEDVRAVMATRAGRRVMHHLLEQVCRTFAETFTGEGHTGDYAQGRRGAGLMIQKLLQDCSPAEFVLLLGEELQARDTNP